MTDTLFTAAPPANSELVTPRPARELTPMVLIEAALERGISAPELEKLTALAERWQANIAAEEFANALAEFQRRCPLITKRRSIDLGGGKGPQYASLDDIMRAITPILSDLGLGITFSGDMTEDGKMHVVCAVSKGRHMHTSEITLPAPAMRVNDTQRMGAALSYARRYALCNALNIVVTNEDTDANGLAQTISEEQCATIREWIEGSGADEKKFCKWLAVERIADIPAAQYEVALRELQRKAGQKK